MGENHSLYLEPTTIIRQHGIISNNFSIIHLKSLSESGILKIKGRIPDVPKEDLGRIETG